MEYKYKAFISYRHIEPDMHAAERLQKILETYKPPKSLGIKKEKWRIFVMCLNCSPAVISAKSLKMQLDRRSILS